MLLRVAAVSSVFLAIFGLAVGALAAQPKPAWQQEWEKTLDAAKKEGQVVVYIGGYEAVLPDFEKEFPEIKLVVVSGARRAKGPTVISERRGDKYLADVFSTGANATYQQLYPAKVLDPIKPALILPESNRPIQMVLKESTITPTPRANTFSTMSVRRPTDR